MARTLFLFRLPDFDFAAPEGAWLRAGAAVAFLCGVGAGLVHARLLGIL